MAKYGMSILVPGTIEEVKPQVLNVLKAQGFGVLTEIDVQKTMKEKIGAEYEPYLILGACNPQLANRALTAEPGHRAAAAVQRGAAPGWRRRSR